MTKHLKYILISLLALSTHTAGAQNDSVFVVHDSELDTDAVIGIPESMMADIDSLLMLWNSKQYMFPLPSNETATYLTALTDSDFQERLNRIPAIVEMPYNNIVRQFIDQYTGKNNKTISFCLGAGNFYIPMFEEALAYYDLPFEFKYLPIIESSLNPMARSKAGAVGLWQFMLATGKRYGLEVNSFVDERQDPVKSTWAAARYLKDLYDIYHDWSLVIAAYNYGPGNINKAIHRAGGEADYWKIYPFLPTETRGYVPAFIAVNYAMQYYCDHHITPMQTQYPIATDTVIIDKMLHFQQVADLCNINIDALRALNPQYKKDIIPGNVKPYALRLPQETLLTFIDLEDSVYLHRSDELLKRRTKIEIPNEVATPSGSKPKTIRVRKGENLGSIAAKYKTTVAKLRKLNGLKNNNIRAGQKLRIR